MSQTIFVIGATGTVGSLVVKGLLTQSPKPKIRVLTREKAKAQKFGQDVEVIEGDYTDISKVKTGLQGADRVFLLTISKRSQASEEKAIAEASKAAGVKQIVKISAIGVSPAEPLSSGLRWQYDAENEVVASGVPTVILRPNNFLSNFTNDSATIKSSGVFYRLQGDYRIAYIDVQDIADVAVKILGDDPAKHNGETYYLTGPESLTFNEVATIISEAIGKEVKYVPVDDAGLHASLTSAGVPAYVTSFLLKLFQSYRTNSSGTVQGDVKLVTGKEARSLKNYFTENKALFT